MILGTTESSLFLFSSMDLFQPCVRMFYHIVTRVWPWYVWRMFPRNSLTLHLHFDCCSNSNGTKPEYYNELRIIMSKWKSYYWFVICVENPPPASYRLVVQIVLSLIHQKNNRRCLMHRALNYLYIRPLCFQFWWTWHTTTGTTSHHLAGDEFSNHFMNQQLFHHFKTFLRSSYEIRRICTKSKCVLHFQQQKRHTHTKMYGLRKPTTRLSEKHITQTPQEPQS